MASNIASNGNKNNNPLWIVILVLVSWLIFFIYKLYNTI